MEDLEDLDFTKPSQSSGYDPAAARAFFEGAGKAEEIPAGTKFFVEQQRQGLFSSADRMYLLLEGAVVLSIGGKSIDTVSAGEIFGEMATITNSPRSATATAKSACRVIALTSGQFQKAIQNRPGFALMLLSIMIDRLQLTFARLAMMKGLPDTPAANARRVLSDTMLDEIARELRSPPLMKFAAGQTIIKAGETGVRMYLPRKGRVAITANGRTLEYVGPGGVFGEMALVDRAPRAATVVAETDCEMMTVNRTQFLDLVQTNPGFGLSLLKIVGQRLQAATARTSK